MNGFTIDIHRVWRPVLTPDNIKDLFVSRLDDHFGETLDVYDLKELLNLKSLRFAERLFSMIDTNGIGFISLDSAINFIYSFESQDFRSRLHLIFLCYDPTHRGSLTFSEIRTMFTENFIEGGYRIDPNTSHFLTKQLIGSYMRGIELETVLLTYPQLMELASMQLQFFLHLVKSKVPLYQKGNKIFLQVESLKNLIREQFSKIVFIGVICLIIAIVGLVGVQTYQSGSEFKFFGIFYVISHIGSDVCKILIPALLLTFCHSVSFLSKKLPKAGQLTNEDIKLIRKVVFVVLLLSSTVHSIAEIYNMWKATHSNFMEEWAQAFPNQDQQPSHSNLIKSNVLITGFLLLCFSCLISSFFSLEDIPLSSHKRANIMEFRRVVYWNGYIKILCILVFVILMILHSCTTFFRKSFHIPCLLFAWLGFPVLILLVDQVLFKFMETVQQMEITGYKIWLHKGILLSLTKPSNISMGILSHTSLTFPFVSQKQFSDLSVLSHPLEDRLAVFLNLTDSWSEGILSFFENLNEIEDGQMVTQEPVLVDRRVNRHRPQRLTRLGTRVRQRTEPINVSSNAGSESRPTTRRNTSTFNLVFEISPATESSNGSDARDSLQHVRMPSVVEEVERTMEKKLTIPRYGVNVDVHQFHSLLTSLQEQELMKMFLCDTVLLLGSNSSLSLISLCKYLLKSTSVHLRPENGERKLRRVVVSWEVSSLEDAMWVIELLEPLLEVRSTIEVETMFHIHHNEQWWRTWSPNFLLFFLEDMLVNQNIGRLPIHSKVDINLGKRDCIYQLEKMKNEVGNETMGIIMEGSYNMRNQIHKWVNNNNEGCLTMNSSTGQYSLLFL